MIDIIFSAKIRLIDYIKEDNYAFSLLFIIYYIRSKIKGKGRKKHFREKKDTSNSKNFANQIYLKIFICTSCE